MEKTQVQIVSGTLRGRRMTVFVHEGLRPTPQMVREALFSILGNAVPGRTFYDIFAGTGVIGMEAVSRGASDARLIEENAKQVSAIQRHADQFGVADRVQVLRSDGYRWAERWVPPARSGPVNLFLSPPFPDLEADKVSHFLALVNTLLDKAPLESVLTIQAEDGFPADQLPEPETWDVRSYGRNMLLFKVKEATEPTPPGTAV